MKRRENDWGALVAIVYGIEYPRLKDSDKIYPNQREQTKKTHIINLQKFTPIVIPVNHKTKDIEIYSISTLRLLRLNFNLSATIVSGMNSLLYSITIIVFSVTKTSLKFRIQD